MRKILPYTLPVFITLLFVLTANTSFIWVTAAVIYLIALMRNAVGKFDKNKVLNEYRFFHYSKSMAILKTFSGLIFVVFNIWVLWFLTQHSLPVLAYIIFIFTCIIINSNFAVSLAHDLMHSKNGIDRLLSNILLIQNGFFYLRSDHMYTHHRYVATAGDPSTARFNENIYAYLYRSIKARIRITFIDGLTYPLKVRNKIIFFNYLFLTCCILYLGFSMYLGRNVFIYLFINYLCVTLIYESVTYIQHYGLNRKYIDDLNYYKVEVQHAWNCFYKTSAYMHYMMPVHSIHHLSDDSLVANGDNLGNEMPRPFATMMLTAWFPGRWFRLMNGIMPQNP